MQKLNIFFYLFFFPIAFVAVVAFFFAGSCSWSRPDIALAAETNFFEQTQVTTGPAYWYRFLADNFTLTQRQLASGIRHYFAATTTEINLKAYILRNNCSNAGCFDEDLVVDSCILHYSGSGLAETVACEFDYSYTLFPGDFHIRLENLYYPDPMPAVISSTVADSKLSSSVYYNINGTFGTNAGDHINIQLYYDDTLIEAETNTVEIDPWTGDEFISNEYFTIQKSLECLIATTCPIRFWYGPDDVGSDVYLLKQGEGDLTQYDDVIYSLSDKPLLYDTLYPEISTTTGTQLYQYFVSPATGSSSLYTYTKVYWVEELSEDAEDAGIISVIWSKLKNVFPLSLLFQIREILNDVRSNANNEEYIDIGLDSLIATQYDPLVSSSTSILNRTLITDNLPIWEEKIFPFMEAIIYIMNFLMIIFILSPKNSQEN